MSQVAVPQPVRGPPVKSLVLNRKLYCWMDVTVLPTVQSTVLTALTVTLACTEVKGVEWRKKSRLPLKPPPGSPTARCDITSLPPETARSVSRATTPFSVSSSPNHFAGSSVLPLKSSHSVAAAAGAPAAVSKIVDRSRYLAYRIAPPFASRPSAGVSITACAGSPRFYASSTDLVDATCVVVLRYRDRTDHA